MREIFVKKVENECKDCLYKKLKLQVFGKFFIKKWLTSHIEGENQKEFYSSVLEKPKVLDC